MNAPNLLSEDKRSAERKAYEPSMEEILASIRQIITDDQAFAVRRIPAQAVTEPKPAPAAVAEPEALALRRRNIPKANGPEPTVARETVAASPAIETPGPAAAPTAARVPPASVAGFPVEAQFQFFKIAAMPAAAEPSPPEVPIEPRARRPAAVSEAEETPWLAPQPPLERDVVPRPVRAAAEVPEESADEEPPLVSPETDAAVASAFNALIASRFLPSDEALTDMVRETIRPMLKAWLDDNLPVLVERLVRAEIERVARGGR